VERKYWIYFHPYQFKLHVTYFLLLKGARSRKVKRRWAVTANGDCYEPSFELFF
jgi:hypothetical protein